MRVQITARGGIAAPEILRERAEESVRAPAGFDPRITDHRAHRLSDALGESPEARK